jgi:hypothetical protein
VSSPENGHHKDGSSAMYVADGSYNWYKRAAIRSRRCFRASEVVTIAASASIPICAVVFSEATVIAAILGGVVIISTGLRTLFHWQENYLRYSRAREAVEAERRRYKFGSKPYDSPNERDGRLVEAVTRIEQEEMGQWLQIANPTQVAEKP